MWKQSARQAFDDEVGDLKQQLEAEMKKRKCDSKVIDDMSQLLGSLIGREYSEWFRGGVQEWQKSLVRQNLRTVEISMVPE
jgi:hypothetical protein